METFADCLIALFLLLGFAGFAILLIVIEINRVELNEFEKSYTPDYVTLRRIRLMGLKNKRKLKRWAMPRQHVRIKIVQNVQSGLDDITYLDLAHAAH